MNLSPVTYLNLTKIGFLGGEYRDQNTRDEECKVKKYRLPKASPAFLPQFPSQGLHDRLNFRRFEFCKLVIAVTVLAKLFN